MNALKPLKGERNPKGQIKSESLCKTFQPAHLEKLNYSSYRIRGIGHSQILTEYMLPPRPRLYVACTERQVVPSVAIPRQSPVRNLSLSKIAERVRTVIMNF